jgi:hypothetical protein
MISEPESPSSAEITTIETSAAAAASPPALHFGPLPVGTLDDLLQ